MQDLPLKYQGFTVAFQEVPNEVSLVFNISGCPYKCKGCHSPNLWKYQGRYLSEDFDTVIYQYIDLITCVCFMGGNQNMQELKQMLITCKMKGLKTCLYTGCNDINELCDILEYCDYLKLGQYIEELKVDNYISNGVKLATRNQKFYIKGQDY